MNERIKQLLSQAGVHYEVMPKDTVYEKFAELIVQECIQVIHEQESIPDGFFYAKGATIHEVAIREHFGVEE